MRYKDHIAQLTNDPSADSFHGRVIGMRDVLAFCGRTPEELRREFAVMVDDSLAWCAKEGTQLERTPRIPEGAGRGGR